MVSVCQTWFSLVSGAKVLYVSAGPRKSSGVVGDTPQHSGGEKAVSN